MKKINKLIHTIINLIPCIFLAFVMIFNYLPSYYSNGDTLSTINNKTFISSDITDSFSQEISYYTFVSIDNDNSINSYKDFYFSSVETFYSSYNILVDSMPGGVSYSLTYQININYYDYLNFSRLGVFSLHYVEDVSDNYSYVHSFDFGFFGNFIDKYIIRNFYSFSSSSVILPSVYSRESLDNSLDDYVFKTLFYCKNSYYGYFLWLLNTLFIFNILYYIYYIVVSLFTFIFKVLEN